MKTLEKQGIVLEVTEKAREFLANSGFTPKYGARPLQGVIRNQIRRPLSRMIITGELSRGDTIKLDMGENDTLVWTK
jgi:ATP-dependent Clp protease ATP-binding subunit ClpB